MTHPMHQEKLPSRAIVELAALIAVGLIVFVLRLGNTHLWDQDEGYYASAAAEMFARKDWVVPTFNGELFAHKPPMMYWGMMIGFHLFGVNELGARFFSSLFAISTAVVTYLLGKRIFDNRTGMIAGLAISSSLMFVMVGRSATADAYLSFFVALSILLWCRSYWNAIGETRDIRIAQVRWMDWARVYAVMGLAVLTKGPIGFLFPMAAIGLFLLTERASERANSASFRQLLLETAKSFAPMPFLRTLWLMRPWTAVLAVTLVVAPWTCAVQWRTGGQFLQEFIGVHHMGRFSQPMDNHSGPFYYYFLACLVGLYPWTAFALPTGMSWARDSISADNSKACRLVTCWVVVYVAIFSIASTKLPNYVLPAYPALALMIGKFMANWSSNASTLWTSRWTQVGWCLLFVVGAVLCSVFPLTTMICIDGKTVFDEWRIEPELSKATWLLFGIAGLPLILVGIVGWLSYRRHDSKTAIVCFATGAVSFLLLLSQFIAPEIDRLQGAQRLAERRFNSTGDAESDQTILAFGRFKPSLVFYAKRPVQFCQSADEVIEELDNNPKAFLLSTVNSAENIERLGGVRRIDESLSLPGEPAWVALESSFRMSPRR